eukprot:tig00000821_g4501.t1
MQTIGERLLPPDTPALDVNKRAHAERDRERESPREELDANKPASYPFFSGQRRPAPAGRRRSEPEQRSSHRIAEARAATPERESPLSFAPVPVDVAREPEARATEQKREPDSQIKEAGEESAAVKVDETASRRPPPAAAREAPNAEMQHPHRHGELVTRVVEQQKVAEDTFLLSTCILAVILTLVTLYAGMQGGTREAAAGRHAPIAVEAPVGAAAPLADLLSTARDLQRAKEAVLQELPLATGAALQRARALLDGLRASPGAPGELAHTLRTVAAGLQELAREARDVEPEAAPGFDDTIKMALHTRAAATGVQVAEERTHYTVSLLAPARLLRGATNFLLIESPAAAAEAKKAAQGAPAASAAGGPRGALKRAAGAVFGRAKHLGHLHSPSPDAAGKALHRAVHVPGLWRVFPHEIEVRVERAGAVASPATAEPLYQLQVRVPRREDQGYEFGVPFEFDAHAHGAGGPEEAAAAA